MFMVSERNAFNDKLTVTAGTKRQHSSTFQCKLGRRNANYIVLKTYCQHVHVEFRYSLIEVLIIYNIKLSSNNISTPILVFSAVRFKVYEKDKPVQMFIPTTHNS